MKSGRFTKDLPLTEAVFYILLALRHPNHGYGIIQEVEEMTEGRLVLGAGTLYGAIQTLEKKHWISVYSAEEGSRKKKEYLLTPEGREVFLAETERLQELLGNAGRINSDLIGTEEEEG
ncbi:MAG: PadR family transcriptional regulator [Lachnospiraceae bacterium]|nr:PadR family transcriptional regulator [Lachnospiraceae bacterium]